MQDRGQLLPEVSRRGLVVAAAATGIILTLIGVAAVRAGRGRFVLFWGIAAANTAFLFLGASTLGLVIGFLAGWARATDRPVVDWPALAYIESFRGIPRIVIILLAIVIFPALARFGDANPWFILSPVLSWLGGIDQAVWWGIVALGISSGAYQAEVFRSGFESIPTGQIEAAHSVGMDGWQTMKHVTLPQVIRSVLPPLGNEWIIVLKDTSLLVLLVSIPGTFPSVFELTARARFLQTVSPDVTIWPLIFLATAAIYLVMTLTISYAIQIMEERYQVPGLGVREA